MITIVCLIYRSTKYAKAVYENLHKYTPMLSTGEAELLFVANDATPEVLKFLKDNKYPHIVNNNPIYTDEQLLERGYYPPEYIGRVYRGYNQGVKAAKGEIVVLINSDNLFAPNWLENLCKHMERRLVVCSRLVERSHPVHGVFCMALHADFGSHPDNFREKEFIEYAEKIATEYAGETTPGGAFMPCMIYKDVFEKVGGYPEGNKSPLGDSSMQTGDKVLFEKFFFTEGMGQLTICDSLSYHFKEGERDE
jgi:glycosyltransferase involved in cell wall biosynthesis